MTKKILANSIGCVSILGSLAVGIEFALNSIPGFPRVDLSISALAVLWLISFVLAIGAAALGSRRWALAALLPVLMFVLALTVVYLNEPRKSGSYLREGNPDATRMLDGPVTHPSTPAEHGTRNRLSS